MNSRFRLLLALIATVGMVWLLPTVSNYSHRQGLTPTAEGSLNLPSDRRSQEEIIVATTPEPLEQKLLRHGYEEPLVMFLEKIDLKPAEWQLNTAYCYTHESTTFQEVCNLLGCRVEDFTDLRFGWTWMSGFPYQLRRHDFELSTKDYTCKIWLADDDPPKNRAEFKVIAAVAVDSPK